MSRHAQIPDPPVATVTVLRRPAAKPPRRRRLPTPQLLRPRDWAIGFGVVAVLGIAAALTFLPLGRPVVAPGPAAIAQTIGAGRVTLAPMERSLVVTGSLAAWDELPIGAETGGLAITAVAVEQGDRVAKGQLLAKLDDSVLKAQLAQAEATVAQGEAGLRRAEATIAPAQSDLRRAQELLKNGHISGQVAEQREANVAVAEADLSVARQTLETDKAMRDERRARLVQTEIRAPADGIVSKRSATLGSVVSSGQELFRLIRDGKVELRAEVPELDLPRLTMGQKVTVTLEGDGSHTYDGSIRLIGATVDPQSRVGLVYIALPADAGLKPGMFVHGVVDVGRVEALDVPEAALVFKDGKPGVFVIGEDDRVRLHAVATGARAGGNVEVVSGVGAGERIAVTGAGFLKDGDLVKLAEPAGAATAATP